MQLPTTMNVSDVHQAVNMCTGATPHGCHGSEAPGGREEEFSPWWTFLCLRNHHVPPLNNSHTYSRLLHIFYAFVGY